MTGGWANLTDADTVWNVPTSTGLRTALCGGDAAAEGLRPSRDRPPVSVLPLRMMRFGAAYRC